MNFEQLKIMLVNLGFRKTWYYKNERFLYTLIINDKFTIDVTLNEDLNNSMISLEYLNDIDFYQDDYDINDVEDIEYDNLDKLYYDVLKLTSKFFRKDKLKKILEK